MADISGRLLYDGARTANPASVTTGIANVPVILQNTATNETLAVLTDASGNYAFTNVPSGGYRIVEAYGTPASPSPGDFANAVPGSPQKAATPPISFVENPATGATHLDATTPDTLLVTVSGADISGQDILNGPVKYSPVQTILDESVTVLPENLITGADGGTFGSFPQGTPANTGANPNPYTDIGTDFMYTQPNPVGITPGPRQYTVQNIMNDATANVQSTWWRISDHTSGNETGRMMVVNGDVPGAVIFQQRVTVKPGTYYLLSSWILNMANNQALAEPKLGVEVSDANGKIMYSATLGALISVNLDEPEWKQIGTILNSRDNSSLTVRFTS
ncbi:MAG: cell surface protein, partial [Clostridiales bacterium]|nr:cell surface protein [Clostridiales bacterium]